ncbi:NAD(P)-dependent oxidoreductase [Vagococcus zengguangii]|uniref:SDR family oxidoreductase n=1 Tax=Vagococcus zengguangii TaxID=2571750 RepID=A0A4D7CZB6_9ENTE|nr:NAD(P)-binding oxidoreductase [Vagococcus zengguangii]QCI86926.1 SDR family oxidoreductase [Vagococcus zengguangii]TLG81032.1 SDR family oxidoreductase [Vagococcus zengguangii]
MNLLIIGATGQTGQELVTQALASGHQVTVYIRKSWPLLTHADLKIITGQLTEKDKLVSAMRQQDAVLVTLGNPKSNKSAPLFETVMPVIINAMEQVGLKRIIKMSAMGVGETFVNAPLHYKIAAKTFLKGAFTDHERGEQLLMSSSLNWTTLHPEILVDKQKTVQPYVALSRTNLKMPINSTTRRVDVAQVMLSLLNDETTYERQVLMCSKQSH